MDTSAADSPAAGAAGAVQLAVERTYVRSRTDAALVAVLAIIAFYFLIYPAWRAHFLIEIWPTEGWNAYFQDMAAAGRNIYPASDSLIVNNYPPLSFYAVGLLSRIFGDSLFVGRALSLLALIVVSVEIFFCIRALGGRMASGAIGALWYVAIMSHHFTSYVGVNDPQLAGEAIMGAGLVLFLVRENSGGSPLAPLLIMVIGGFWKHNMIAIPLTAIIWLLARRGRQSWGVVAISAATTIGGLAACRAIFGAAFFSNLFAVRQYSLGHLISQIGTLQWCALAFIIWLSWAIRSRTMTARFTLLYVAISLASCLLQWCGDDVFGSAELDLMIALGIATGIAFESINFPPPPLARDERVEGSRRRASRASSAGRQPARASVGPFQPSVSRSFRSGGASDGGRSCRGRWDPGGGLLHREDRLPDGGQAVCCR